MVRRIHSILLLFALLVGGAGMNYVQAATYSGSCGTNATWSYNTINCKLTISGSGAMTNYTSSSPAPWNSYKTSILTISIANTITSIGNYAFAQCRRIISVSIGTGVTSIGSYAFSGCTLLSGVTTPNGVTTIGEAAFYNCSNLSYVSIPSSVTSLGSQAFYGCTKLTSISIPNSVTKLGTYTLSGSGIVDIYVYWTTTSGDHCIPVWTTGFVTKVPQTAVTLHVPCGTRSMYMGLTGWRDFTVVEPQYTITAQTNNSSYGTVKIDDGTAGADVSKTVNCATSVTLTAVTTTSECNIGFLQWNDGNKDNPRTITAERSITYTAQFGTIGGDCGASGNNLTWSLNRCTGVLTISGSGAMADWSAEADVPWYNYRTNITSVVLPVGLTSIGAYAFYGCAITKIDIPAAVRNFGKMAFQQTSLRELYIPEGVTAIPEEFVGASQRAFAAPLERIYLPSTLTTIGAYSLSFTRLRTLTIPKSVTNSSIVIPWNINKTPFNNIYASWTENVPQRGGRVEARNPYLSKMHVPYGAKSLYTGSASTAWSYVCSIVEDVDERAIDLGLSIRWASCNIGATAPEENGNFYAWGDTLTRSSFTWGTYPYSGTSTNTMTKYCTRAANGTVDNRSTLIAFDDAAYINWGETWRMPTWTEWNELITQCTWKDTTINNVSVWQVTGPNGNSIYLPKVGYKNNSSVTAGCYYWSSTLNTANSNDQCNRALYINAANRSGAMYGLRYVGMPVRAVYRREWPSFTLTITDTPEGTSYTKAINAGSSYTLTAQEDACRPFVRWSDGNTENPRTVTVTEDATYTAEYEDTSLASGTCGANVTWKLCDGTLTISGTGAMSNYPAINMPWKSHRASITSVVISDGVTSIGYNAFNGCSNLTSVTIPPSVTSIEQNAFYGCYAMESLYITDLAAWCNVEFGVSVEATPFMRNNYNSGSTEYLGGGNLYLNGTLVTTLTIPDGITEIKNLTFLGCSSITSIDFNQVTTIGSASFKGCHGLTSVTLPEGVTSLKNAFPYCTQLQSISIPASLTSLTTQTLYHSDALTDIYVYWTDNIPGWPGYFTAQSPQPSITLHVPCGTEELYNTKANWKKYTIEGEGGPYTVTVQAEDPTMGDVSIVVN